MLGSAAQNVIVLTDNVFLFHKSPLDFASIGIVGVFYLMIASIGYGFSRGGQIIIARRYGERAYIDVGRSFYALLALELILAIFLFLFLQFGSPLFFQWFIGTPEIYDKCLEYIFPRSYGVFFSYAGVALIALYTGIAKTRFIIYDTLILASVNLILNYLLIFGKWGFPEMGIAGAGLASTIAEIVAFVVFVLYMLKDRSNRIFKLFNWPTIDFQLIKRTLNVSIPIVMQGVLGLGSWFIFFSLIENKGQQELEISNLIRNIYLILSIPCWGFAAGINTIVSNFIGQKKRQAVIPLIWRTAKLNLFVTLLISLPVIIFPSQLLYPLFGSDDMSIILLSKPTLWVLLGILATFSIGAIYFNGLVGTGATPTGLRIQLGATIVYLLYIFYIIDFTDLPLPWAWASEILYWFFILLISMWFLQSKKWHFLRI